MQASTVGALETLVKVLREKKIPVAHLGVGPLQKKQVLATSAILEKKPQYAAILAFEVKISDDARKTAEALGVRLFEANVIYQLADAVEKYLAEWKEEKKRSVSADAVG